MSDDRALRSVLVAGGGLTAWCAAAALRRRAPFLRVTLLATPPCADALADRIACTLPSLPGFMADLGVGPGDTVVRSGSGYRLGTCFAGWATGLPDYAHVYDRYGQPLGQTAFHLQWIGAARRSAPPRFDAFAPAAVLGRACRFVTAAPGTPFAAHDHGLTIDPARFLALLAAFADHVGVDVERGEIATVEQDARGFVAAVRLEDGRALTADLFVDATGPAARLRGAIDGERRDWRAWLPCDRVMLAADAPDAEPPVLTPVAAHAASWRWTSGAQRGIAYAASHLSDAAAAAALPGAGAPIRIDAGTRSAPWRFNCVAIGDAATQVEPLEWCNLHLALSAIDRLVAMLPDRAMTPVEADDFNRQTLAEAERVRDFLAMHYRTARRPEPMWRAVAAAEPPASLAHTLTQFAERGRLPFYEEETFTRDGWAAVLLGQGVVPRRVDPLADALPAAEVDAALARLAATLAAAAAAAPTHAAFRAAQTRQLLR